MSVSLCRNEQRFYTYVSNICGNSNSNLIKLFLLSSSSFYFPFSNSYDIVVNSSSPF